VHRSAQSIICLEEYPRRVGQDAGAGAINQVHERYGAKADKIGGERESEPKDASANTPVFYSWEKHVRPANLRMDGTQVSARHSAAQ